MKKATSKLVFSLLIILLVLISGLAIYLYLETQRLEEEKTQAVADIIFRADEQIIDQKKQKNEIADIFDDQAALNDDLNDEQRDLIRSMEEYLALIEETIRFVEGRPQLFENVSETEFLEIKNGVIQEIDELNRIAQENSDTKERNTNRINQIYLESGEDRNNTANEREGFR